MCVGGGLGVWGEQGHYSKRSCMHCADGGRIAPHPPVTAHQQHLARFPPRNPVPPHCPYRAPNPRARSTHHHSTSAPTCSTARSVPSTEMDIMRTL